jgi:cytochrome P450
VNARPVLDPRDLAGIDLADVRLHADHDLTLVWRHLRDERPVHWNPSPGTAAGGFWAVTRYADVLAVYRDHRRFTSTRGNVLATLLHGGDSAGGRMIAVSDGPRHRAVRSLLSAPLGPRGLSRLRDQVHTTARRLVRAAVERGRCDFAREVAAHLPLLTICDLLGVPDGDRPFIREQVALALGSDRPAQPPAEVWLARNEILLYFRMLTRDRRASPADDLVSTLAHGRIDGEELSEDEVILNCYSLILGGDETTRLSMTGAVAAFAERPAVWRRFAAGEFGTAGAVEEVLRWTSPAMHGGRTAVEDVELHGERIRAGEVVSVWTVSANQDEREFPRPGVFDLGRSPNRHLGFGYGSHFCLGAYLARLELTALLTVLRELVGHIEPAGPPGRIFSNFLAGCTSLPVELTPAAS